MKRDDEVRVLIVDDEPLARDFLRRSLEEAPGVRVVGECPDGEAAVAAIEAEEPDLVLLDVRMPEVDGFDVVARVGAGRMPEVVFVTAHEEYTLRAFQVHALDYVVKPCDPARILEAVEHARTRILAGGAWRLQERLEALVREREGRGPSDGRHGRHGRHGRGEPPRRLAVRKDDRVIFVDVADLDWIEADGNGVLLHAGDAVHRVRASLTGLLERLESRGFVRIHRSAALNVDRVTEVLPWGHGDHVAVLTTGKKLRVSRTYKDGLLKLVH